jgi:hypothetical protein
MNPSFLTSLCNMTVCVLWVCMIDSKWVCMIRLKWAATRVCHVVISPNVAYESDLPTASCSSSIGHSSGTARCPAGHPRPRRRPHRLTTPPPVTGPPPPSRHPLTSPALPHPDNPNPNATPINLSPDLHCSCPPPPPLNAVVVAGPLTSPALPHADNPNSNAVLINPPPISPWPPPPPLTAAATTGPAHGQGRPDQRARVTRSRPAIGVDRFIFGNGCCEKHVQNQQKKRPRYSNSESYLKAPSRENGQQYGPKKINQRKKQLLVELQCHFSQA